MTPGQKEEVVQKCVAVLSEHFDCVQILASELTPENNTGSIFSGSGNWYARQGMAREFITRDQSNTQARYIARSIKPEDS